MSKWDELTMAEKAEMIGVAVRNGITNLQDIRKKYNEFAEGGDTKEENITPWKALDNIDYTAIPDTTFTRDKTGAGSIEVMFNNTPEEGYEYGTGYKYPHPMPGHNVVIYNPKDNDAQDIRLDALHIMPQDATYDALRSELAYYADNSDIANNAKERMKDDIKQYGHLIPGMTYQDYYNNEIDGFLRNMFIEGSPEYISSKRYYPNQQQLREWNKELMPYVDRIHNYLLTGQRPANILPEVVITGNKHSIGGPLVEAAMNEYKSGGDIHIKPSHRGRLTELKKRTGKSEAELYRTGSPATRKMITFARNARKWKHGLGGNLFSGKEEGSQQMNIFRRPNGEYFYQASPDSKEIAVTPIMTTLGDESMWTYQDENGRRYTPRLTSNEETITQGETPSTWENIIATSNNNYMDPVLGAPARWKASWDNNTNAVRALWNNPAITGHPLGMAAKAVEHLADDEGLSKTIRLYQNSDGSDNARWLWQRSLTGDALTFLGLLPAAAEGYQLGNRALQKGRRFILDVGDRYQGMKDAAAYRSANGDMDARTIANIKWWENGGTPTGINKMGISNNGDLGIYYIDKSDNEPWFSPAIEKGGNMTLTTHLGGDIPGEYTKDVLPMSKSEMAALAKYLKGVPENTYLGEIGKTKNYAEQYFNIKPSRTRAFKDAIHNKKEINEPYWNEEEYITDFMEEKDPIQKAYYSHLYEANEPLSADSYKFILQEAAKDNGRFALRYDSSPMGLFNPQGFYENNFYESLLPLVPEEQVYAINRWMRSYYPDARPAYLENGKVMIPRPLLMLKNKK